MQYLILWFTHEVLKATKWASKQTLLYLVSDLDLHLHPKVKSIQYEVQQLLTLAEFIGSLIGRGKPW